MLECFKPDAAKFIKNSGLPNYEMTLCDENSNRALQDLNFNCALNEAPIA
jgi:hypothetical protein